MSPKASPPSTAEVEEYDNVTDDGEAVRASLIPAETSRLSVPPADTSHDNSQSSDATTTKPNGKVAKSKKVKLFSRESKSRDSLPPPSPVQETEPDVKNSKKKKKEKAVKEPKKKTKKSKDLCKMFMF